MNNRSNLSRAMVHRRGANGLTLIELGFVIIILAVIVAVALTYYNTLSRNKEVTDVVPMLRTFAKPCRLGPAGYR